MAEDAVAVCVEKVSIFECQPEGFGVGRFQSGDLSRPELEARRHFHFRLFCAMRQAENRWGGQAVRLREVGDWLHRLADGHVLEVYGRFSLPIRD